MIIKVMWPIDYIAKIVANDISVKLANIIKKKVCNHQYTVTENHNTEHITIRTQNSLLSISKEKIFSML